MKKSSKNKYPQLIFFHLQDDSFLKLLHVQVLCNTRPSAPRATKTHILHSGLHIKELCFPAEQRPLNLNILESTASGWGQTKPDTKKKHPRCISSIQGMVVMSTKPLLYLSHKYMNEETHTSNHAVERPPPPHWGRRKTLLQRSSDLSKQKNLDAFVGRHFQVWFKRHSTRISAYCL